jgi:hypothetical protein
VKDDCLCFAKVVRNLVEFYFAGLARCRLIIVKLTCVEPLHLYWTGTSCVIETNTPTSEHSIGPSINANELSMLEPSSLSRLFYPTRY